MGDRSDSRVGTAVLVSSLGAFGNGIRESGECRQLDRDSFSAGTDIRARRYRNICMVADECEAALRERGHPCLISTILDATDRAYTVGGLAVNKLMPNQPIHADARAQIIGAR